MLHGLIALAGQINGQLLRLFRLQIEGVQIASVFEDDGIGAEAGPHYIEFIEACELLELFAIQVVAIEIEMVLGATIRIEIDGVAMPHREGVHPIGMWHHGIDRIIFQVVDGDVLGQASGVAFPGAEIAEYLVVGNTRPVRRKRSKAALIHGKGLRQSAVDADTVRTFDPTVGSIAAR